MRCGASKQTAAPSWRIHQHLGVVTLGLQVVKLEAVFVHNRTGQQFNAASIVAAAALEQAIRHDWLRV